MSAIIIRTVLDSKALSPFIQCNVFVVVKVTLFKETGGAVLHGDEGGTERRQLSVGEVSVGIYGT